MPSRISSSVNIYAVGRHVRIDDKYLAKEFDHGWQSGFTDERFQDRILMVQTQLVQPYLRQMLK